MDIVYCLSNEGMPGLFKIGFTTRTGARRARELYSGYRDANSTGVPFAFEVVKEWEVPSGYGEEVERAIHRVLAKRRPNPSREFFSFDDPTHAIAAINDAMRELDWYATAVADAEQKQAEAALRADRRKAAAEAEQREHQRVKALAARVEQGMKSQVEQAKRVEGYARGLYWAGSIGGVLGFAGAALDAREGYFAFVVAVAVGAYFWNGSTPLKRYLQSNEYKARLAAAIASAEPQMDGASTEAQRSGDEHLKLAEAGRRPPEASWISAGDMDATSVEAVTPEVVLEVAPTRPPHVPTAVTKLQQSLSKAVVSARCPKCGCLYAVANVSSGSYVRVYCAGCLSRFETTAAITNEVPAAHAGRVFVTSHPRRIHRDRPNQEPPQRGATNFGRRALELPGVAAGELGLGTRWTPTAPGVMACQRWKRVTRTGNLRIT